ncbi:MAG: amino acid racemase [Phycisphaerae bacterium]|nr:amino acid racemase [Phycisphaerae bacterium]
MAKHIGIVAVSPEGTALCYRDIFRRASAIMGDQGHPVVTLHSEPLEHYIQALLRDDWHTIGELLRKSAKVLAAAGAEFCITPDNVMQHGVHIAQVGSPIPWLTMTDLVADRIVADGRKSVGVIGTKMVMFGSTYQTTLGLKGVKVLAPDAHDADAIDAIVFRELIHGEIVEASRKRVLDAIASLASRGAEGVVLGCSEAPLLISEANSPLPIYDAVALLADGAVRAAAGSLALSSR